MAGPLRRVAIFLALVAAPAFAQQVDANFQALLNALMQGTQVALLTPISDGMVEVTSFSAPGQRSAAEAAQLIERAQTSLGNLGVTKPTGRQLAAALAGGTIELPTGRTQIPGALPQGTRGVALSSQVVATSSLPTVIGMSPAGVAGQSATGGTAPTRPNGGLAGTMAAPQTPQAPIVSPLPPGNVTVPPPSTPTPLLR